MATKDDKWTLSKDKGTRDVSVHNDQLGENASEEYRSDEYSNSMKSQGKNKGLK